MGIIAIPYSVHEAVYRHPALPIEEDSIAPAKRLPLLRLRTDAAGAWSILSTGPPDMGKSRKSTACTITEFRIHEEDPTFYLSSINYHISHAFMRKGYSGHYNCDNVKLNIHVFHLIPADAAGSDNAFGSDCLWIVQTTAVLNEDLAEELERLDTRMLYADLALAKFAGYINDIVNRIRGWLLIFPMFTARSSVLCRGLGLRLSRPTLGCNPINRAGCMAFSASARVVAKTSGETSKLLKQLDKEIKYQQDARSAADATDSITTATVIEEYKDLLEKDGWQVFQQDGNSNVELKKTDGDFETVVSFDVQQVIAEEFEDDTEEYEEHMDESKDSKDLEASEEDVETLDDQPEHTPFPIQVAIKKRGLPEKLVFECTAETDEKGEGSLFIDSIRLARPETTDLYEGPEFHSLDAELQERFESFLEKQINAKGLVDFIRDYAHPKEAAEYETWLSAVKRILA